MKPAIFHVVPATSANPLLMGMVNGVDADFAIGAFGTGSSELKQACVDRGIPFLELGDPGSTFKMANSMRQAIRSLQPDVVEAHTLGPSLAAAVLASVMPARPSLLAVRHHNLNHYLQRSRTGRWGDRLVNARVDAVIAVSYAVRDTCISEGLDRDRCYVALNGLDLRRFLDLSPANVDIERRAKHLLLAVGRLDWQKDYPTMLRCLANLIDRGEDVELAVLGRGSTEVTSDLLQLSAELDVTDRVQWVGWHPDIASWMHSADVFVHSAADEAHPLTLIEVLAAGLPLVATAAGGSREVVQPYYEMVPTRDPTALADRVELVLGNLAEQRSYAESIRFQAAARFDPMRMAEAHLSACRAVLRRRGF